MIHNNEALVICSKQTCPSLHPFLESLPPFKMESLLQAVISLWYAPKKPPRCTKKPVIFVSTTPASFQKTPTLYPRPPIRTQTPPGKGGRQTSGMVARPQNATCKNQDWPEPLRGMV